MKAILTIALKNSGRFCLSVGFALAAFWAAQLQAAVPTSDPAKLSSAPEVQAKKNAAVDNEEVSFPGDGVTLQGTLTKPKVPAGQKSAAIIFITDFYATRDGNVVNDVTYNNYRELADFFAAKGVTVLRFDRRCNGKSGCSAQGTYNSHVDDVLGAVKFLQSIPSVNANKIWLLSHGESSFLGSVVAGHKEVAGLIAIAPVGRSGSKLLREWTTQANKDRNAKSEEIQQYAVNLDALISAWLHASETESILKNFASDRFVAPLAKQPNYAFSWLTDDPLLVMPHVVGHTFIVNGGKDRRIPLKEAAFVKDAYELNDNPRIEFFVAPNMDYFFKENTGNPAPEVDLKVARPLDPAFLKKLDEWIQAKVK